MSNKFVVNFKEPGLELQACIVSRNGDLFSQVHGPEDKVTCEERSIISYEGLVNKRCSYTGIAKLSKKNLVVWVRKGIIRFIAYGGDLLVAVMYLDDTNFQWIMQDPWHRREIKNLPCDIGFQW